MRFVYTSDLHGNIEQYEKLKNYCVDNKIPYLILGGDLLPKNIRGDYIKNQRDFLLNYFGKFLDELNGTLVLGILGNDDAKINQTVLDRYERKGQFFDLEYNSVSLTPKLRVVGLPQVPITPFGIKDWERFDFRPAECPLEWRKAYKLRQDTNYGFIGDISTKEGWKNVDLREHLKGQDSIYQLAAKKLATSAIPTIMVSHCPPDNTCLDQMAGEKHVGSMGLKMAIKKFKPYMCLSGHIHETYSQSGWFQETIGETVCATASNHNEGELALLNIKILEDMKWNIERVRL